MKETGAHRTGRKALLHASLQEYAWQREEQMKAGVQPLLEKAKFADQIQEVVQPYMQTIQGLGIDAPQAVKALMEADHALRYSDPHQKRAEEQGGSAHGKRKPKDEYKIQRGQHHPM